MLNTKFDLYKTEWLDLVFDDRNKAYGAYDLRRHYADNINKAMAIAFGGVISIALLLSFTTKKPVIPTERQIIVNIPTIPIPPVKPPVKASEPAKPQAPKPPSAPIAARAFPPMKIVPEKEVAVDPPVISSLGQNIASVASKGINVAAPIDPPTATNGQGSGLVEDKTIHDFSGLEVMPEPVGGFAAFGNFLGRNLRFPGAAQDAGVAGRVILTFVIEKNGEITNINIDKPAGYGFDQEAMRVLKLAKAWKPGIQNGQPVRVRYSIPINFKLPEE